MAYFVDKVGVGFYALVMLVLLVVLVFLLYLVFTSLQGPLFKTLEMMGFDRRFLLQGNVAYLIIVGCTIAVVWAMGIAEIGKVIFVS